MVSSAFSKKSSRQGLMTISSGRVWRATQAYSLAVFTPPLPLPFAAKKHGSLSDLQPGLHVDDTSKRLFFFNKLAFRSSSLWHSSICMKRLDQTFLLDSCINIRDENMHLIRGLRVWM